jgi:hypothetical protein
LEFPVRTKAVASLPLIDGVGIIVAQDDEDVWRFLSLRGGLDPVRVEISLEDRLRSFESAEAAADYFRQRYGEKLLKFPGSGLTSE